MSFTYRLLHWPHRMTPSSRLMTWHLQGHQSQQWERVSPSGISGTIYCLFINAKLFSGYQFCIDSLLPTRAFHLFVGNEHFVRMHFTILALDAWFVEVYAELEAMIHLHHPNVVKFYDARLMRWCSGLALGARIGIWCPAALGAKFVSTWRHFYIFFSWPSSSIFWLIQLLTPFQNEEHFEQESASECPALLSCHHICVFRCQIVLMSL